MRKRPDPFDMITSIQESALRDYLNALHGLRSGTVGQEEYEQARLRLVQTGSGTNFILYLPDTIKVEVTDYGA